MRLESRHTVYVGINFVLSPHPALGASQFIAFQSALQAQGIAFAGATRRDNQIEVLAPAPAPLSIRVQHLAPQPLGQLLVIAEHPARPLEVLIQEAEAIVAAYQSTWPAPRWQVISCDATLRDLYETDEPHAFREMWEVWLKQQPASLAPLGRPVLGGGLRFVMPPMSSDPEPAQIEVKIESFLANTRQFFVETHCTWPQPHQVSDSFGPRGRLVAVNTFIVEHVLAFIKERLA